jgi:hypothetical protein
MTTPIDANRADVIADLQAGWAADDAALAAANAQIASLEAQLAPYPPTGAYLPSSAAAAAFLARGPVAVVRQYSTPGHIPPVFLPQPPIPGLRISVPSIKPDHPTLDQDAAVTAYAHSLVAWADAAGVMPQLIIEHEPENKAKQPADAPAAYATDWTHYRTVAVRAEPSLEVWACFMTYTMLRRPPDNLGHTTAGENEWIDALNSACTAQGIRPDGIAFDGYPPAGNTAASEFAPNFSYVYEEPGWAAMPVAAAEWGYKGTDAEIAAHIEAGLDFFRSAGARWVSWFDSDGFGIDTDPLSISALLEHNATPA